MWLAARFTALGLSNVHVDAAGNAIGERPGHAAGPPVAVIAHLDTAFPAGTAVEVRRDGDRIMGPGIGDNARGVAVMLALAGEFGVATLTRRTVVFVGTTGEEGAGDLSGAKHFFSRCNTLPHAAIALDGAGDERVVHAAVGSRRLRATFHGPGGHSWTAYGVPNAAHAAARAAVAIASIRLPSKPRTTLSICRFGGGIAVNAIPAESWLEIDIRSMSPVALGRAETETRSALAAAAADENSARASGAPILTVDVSVIGDRPCGETPDVHPLVQTAVQATRLAGREPVLGAASTDANVPISLGIPSVAIGAGGRGGGVHTLEEWYENVDGPSGVGRALLLVAAAAEQ